MNYITQICTVLIKKLNMSETANDIYQNNNKNKSLSEVGVDLFAKFQNGLGKFRPEISLALLGVAASGLFYVIVSFNSIYLYKLAPALAIISMIMMLRFFSIPAKEESKKGNQ
jgi:hypothetical protein